MNTDRWPFWDEHDEDAWDFYHDDEEAHLTTAEVALEDCGADLDEFMTRSTVPPCCSICAPDHDFVEPDGYCRHGFPSVLISLGMI